MASDVNYLTRRRKKEHHHCRVRLWSVLPNILKILIDLFGHVGKGSDGKKKTLKKLPPVRYYCNKLLERSVFIAHLRRSHKTVLSWEIISQIRVLYCKFLVVHTKWP